MNIGLVGWGCATGNGGMNSDIAFLATWITHWLIPDHPNSPNHEPYLEKLTGTEIIRCRLQGDEDIYNKFLDSVDGILYVEHPCLMKDYDIVSEAKRRDKLVIGIPMWEWWPERKPWSFQTDILWAVTSFTNRYLKSLSDVLYVHGYHHNWRNRVYGNRWGVNLNDFPFCSRNKAERFVFINGNGGYKLRKASDVVFEAFSQPGAPPLTVYTQKQNIAQNLPANVELIDKNFPHRYNVYEDGDVFIFTSYWEGLCHGIYEGQACGGVVISTDHAPMNECGTPYLVPIVKLSQEELSGKKIVKAHPDPKALLNICKELYGSDITSISEFARKNVVNNFDLYFTLKDIYKHVSTIS